MVKRLYYDGRAFMLGVLGAVALLATMAGEYLMHNPAQAQDFHNCPDERCIFRTGTIILVPNPATAVILPSGSTLNITLYQVIVLTLSALILVSTLACAKRTTYARRGVLAVAAVLLALTLVFFRAQAPTDLVVGNPSVVPHPFVILYQPITPAPPLIDSFWFMVPAAALGLLSAGIAFLPAVKRTAGA